MTNEIYFDNAATTRVRPEVSALIQKIMTEDYGNPSSKHRKGFEAEQYLRTAREQIAATLRVKPGEILFTSGGTESDNLAIFGTALARSRQGKHIVTCRIEHAAVYQPLLFLEQQGYEITFLPVDAWGHVDPAALEASIRPDTILVSLMYVNNEIGAIEPIEKLAQIVKEKNPDCYFHTDAIQAYSKLRIRPKKEHIDLLSVSSHKFHGPKGAGFLYIDEKVHLHPLILGGGQQHDMRSGTDNVPGAAGMALAASLYDENYQENIKKLCAVKDHLLDRLSAMEGVRINSLRGMESAPQTLSASFAGVRAEVLLHALEDEGIYVSSGSACSSNHPAISGTLKAIGLPKELLDSTLRFSFGLFNTCEEADRCADCIEMLLPKLRRFTRR